MTAPTSMPALKLPGWLDGIDVSEFQGHIDYAKVAAAGFRFAVVRASWGTYVDVMAVQHLAGFRDAGMYAMVYGAARPERGNPRAQAEALLKGMGETYTMAWLDIETHPELPNAQQVDFADEFIEVLENYGALGCGLYSYPWYIGEMQPELGKSNLGRAPLWQAYFGGAQPWVPAWGSSPPVPKPWDRVTLWQYSGGDPGYRVPGVLTGCDRDLFLGTEEELRTKLLGLPPSAP